MEVLLLELEFGNNGLVTSEVGFCKSDASGTGEVAPPGETPPVLFPIEHVPVFDVKETLGVVGVVGRWTAKVVNFVPFPKVPRLFGGNDPVRFAPFRIGFRIVALLANIASFDYI